MREGESFTIVAPTNSLALVIVFVLVLALVLALALALVLALVLALALALALASGRTHIKQVRRAPKARGAGGVGADGWKGRPPRFADEEKLTSTIAAQTRRSAQSGKRRQQCRHDGLTGADAEARQGPEPEELRNRSSVSRER